MNYCIPYINLIIHPILEELSKKDYLSVEGVVMGMEMTFRPNAEFGE